MRELLSILVPVYNEEATVGAVIERLLAIDLPVAREILVVNDGSTDGTRRVLDALPSRGDSLRIVHAAANGGKGLAIRVGFDQARGTIVAIQDADLELDPAELGALVQPILAGETAVVYGSRFLRGRTGAPWLTVAANRVLTVLTNVLYGSRLTDMETCYKVMRTEVARALRLEANRFDIEPEITAKLLRAGHRIVELPVRFEPRGRAQGKKIGWRDGMKAIFVLAKHRMPSSRQLAASAAMTAAILVAAFGIVRGTWAVGGSDSSCYALMASAFARGDVQPYTDLALQAPWPDAARTFAPAGFIPSPVRAGAASPVCAPGFSLLLAAFQWVAGVEGMFLATPLAGALLVWLTFVFGRQIAGPGAGAAAAVIVAATPIVLFQVTQPMNDIVGAALWMAVLVAASSPEPTRAWLLGVFTGLAILVRPNLAPAGAVVGLWIVVTTWREKGGVGTLRRRATAFTLAVAPSIGMVLALNAALYGHPLQSGYGRMSDLFSVQHIVPNLRHYGSAIVETELGLPLFGVAALATVSQSLRPIAWLAVSVAASIAAVYVLYRPFPEWWYLRFLLPALVPLTALAVAAAAHLVASRAQSMMVRGLVVAAVAGITAFGVVTARDRQAFDLQRLEGRFRRSGEIVRARLPANAVFVTVWHSGSVRFHADRPAVLWDSLDPSATDRAIAWLSSRGFEPYLLLERWEEPLFRERFGSRTELGNLDWPPRFDIDRHVRIFKPSDRAAYTQGQSIPTEYIVLRW